VENLVLREEKSNLERSLKVPPRTITLTIDFKATKVGVSKSGIAVTPEDEDTVAVKKEEEVC
jgi:hypothetical protein